MASRVVRINVLLPEEVADDLRLRIPPRKRARFVAEAVARELRRLRVAAALDASAGAWSDADHPDLGDARAVDRWVAVGRDESQWDRPVEQE